MTLTYYSDYYRGVGHVLVEGHDRKTCTTCAYALGFKDGQANPDSLRRARHANAVEEIERQVAESLQDEVT